MTSCNFRSRIQYFRRLAGISAFLMTGTHGDKNIFVRRITPFDNRILY